MTEVSPDRLPPHDEEAEAAFLGCLMLAGPGAASDVLADHPDAEGYFYDLRHRETFLVLRDLAGALKPLDSVTLHGLLKQRGKLEDAGGLPYVAALPDKAPTGGMAAHYAETLRELFIKRRALSACHQIEAEVYSEKPAAALLDTLERELNGICCGNAPNEADARTLVQAAIAEIEEAERSRGQPQGIATGLRTLDWITHGLRPGQLFVIGARPGVGKTSLALNIAAHVTTQAAAPVGFLSLEMTGVELMARLISSASGVPLSLLRSGGASEADLKGVTRAATELVKAPLHIADESGITIAQVKAKARRLHRRHGLKLLVVDYLQLIRPSRPNQSRNVEVSEISSSLKSIAKELGLPLIALSQLNRDSEANNREPGLRDLRDSGSIEQDADIVGLLHRPNMESDSVTLNIAKHRQGPCPKIPLRFDGETFTFTEASPISQA